MKDIKNDEIQKIDEDLQGKVRQKSNKKRGLKGLIASGLALVLLVGGSMAYFTDYATEVATGTAGTVQVSLDDSGINLLNPDGLDILNPGDAKPVQFTVTNEGNKSVDTEIVITLTSSMAMSNTIHGRGEALDPTLYNKGVYFNEYELYWADDVELVEGYGHYPKEGTGYVKERTISDDQKKTVYIIDSGILSGNSSLDEQESEYVLQNNSGDNGSYFELVEGEHYAVKYGDLSRYNSSLGEDYYLLINTSAIDESLAALPASTIWNIVIPETVNVDGNEIVVKYADISVDKYPETGLSRYFVSTQFVGFGYFNIYSFENGFLTVDDVGFRAKVYDDYDALMEEIEYSKKIASKKPEISAIEYNELSDEDKELYNKASDSKTFDFVLLFDPNSNNNFQNSNVSIKIDVRAKQHRNTNDDTWLIADTSFNAIIQDSIFTVEYNGLREIELTGIKDGVDLNSMTEITVPVGVQSIPERFFRDLTNLETIELPDTIESISYAAFMGCTSLKSVDLPDNLRKLNHNAFNGCTSLESVSIPNGVSGIGSNTFLNCSNLKSIVIPNSVISIESSAFAGCTSLSSVKLSNNLTSIDEEVFTDCTSLTSIDIPYGVSRIESRAFYRSGLTSITLPETIVHIDEYAFAECENLESVVLSPKLEYIPEGAFADCTALTSVETNGFGYGNYIGGNIRYINGSAFANTNLASIRIGNGVEAIYSEAFYNCDNLTTIIIDGEYTVDWTDEEWMEYYDGIYIDSDAFYSESDTAIETNIYTDNEGIQYDTNWNGCGRQITFYPFDDYVG